MAPDDPSGSSRPTIQVEVMFSPAPRQIERASLVLPLGSRVQDALIRAGFMARLQTWQLGIWGRRATLDQLLADRDRVEAYRELTVDPKEARRLRYRARGEKIPKARRRPPTSRATD